MIRKQLLVGVGIAVLASGGVSAAKDDLSEQDDFEAALAAETGEVLRAVCDKSVRVASGRAKAMMKRRSRIRERRGGGSARRPRRTVIYRGAKTKACKWVRSVDALANTTCATVADDIKGNYPPNDRLRLAWANKFLGCGNHEALVLMMSSKRTWELLGKRTADAAIVSYLKKHRGKHFLRGKEYRDIEGMVDFYADNGGFKHCKLLLAATRNSSMLGKSAAFPLFALGKCRGANRYAIDALTNRSRKATPRNGYSLYTVELACKMLAATGTRRELAAVRDAAARHDSRLSKYRNAYRACSRAASKIQRR